MESNEPDKTIIVRMFPEVAAMVERWIGHHRVAGDEVVIRAASGDWMLVVVARGRRRNEGNGHRAHGSLRQKNPESGSADASAAHKAVLAKRDRAVKLETTASGTYFNPSQGVADGALVRVKLPYVDGDSRAYNQGYNDGRADGRK